jgi:hypothetical protein
MSDAAGLPETDRGTACARCRRSLGADAADEAGWCDACRRGLIRRAAGWSVPPTLVVGALYGWLLVWSGLVESPALVFFLALGVVVMLVTYKVSRRILFDLLRGRATGDDA